MKKSYDNITLNAKLISKDLFLKKITNEKMGTDKQHEKIEARYMYNSTNLLFLEFSADDINLYFPTMEALENFLTDPDLLILENTQDLTSGICRKENSISFNFLKTENTFIFVNSLDTMQEQEFENAMLS
jgi:hypothetical protein